MRTHSLVTHRTALAVLSLALSFAISASLAPGVRAANLNCPVGTSPSFDGTTCEKPNQTPNATPAPAPQKLTCPIGTSLSLDGTKCETPANSTPVAPPSGATTNGTRANEPTVPSGSLTETPRGINMAYLNGYFDDLSYVINVLLVPLLIAIAFIFFLYGIYKYFILGADNDTELEEGRKFALWGVIGFALILSVWGLVWVVIDTFSLAPGGIAPPTPTL